MPRVYYFDVRCVPHADRFLDKIPVVRNYDHRALLVADEADFVLLRSPVDPDYVKYLNSFGLGPKPEHVLVVGDSALESESIPRAGETGSLRALAARLRADNVEECILLPYLHHQKFIKLAAKLREDSGVTVAYPAQSIDPAFRYTSKAEARKLAAKLGLPLPEGILMEADAEKIASLVLRRFSPERALVLKGVWGEAGTETRKLAAGWNRESLSEELSRWWDRDSPLIIEEAIEEHLATNVMLHICEVTGAVTVIGVTDQLITDETCHVGNQFPTRSAWERVITEASIKIAAALRDEGFYGYAGVDFMETLPGDDVLPRYYFLEINPRVNASLHPLLVMRKLNGMQSPRARPKVGAFLDLSFPVEAMSFGEVRDLLTAESFDPQSGCGIIFYSPNFINAGSLSLQLLGPTEHDVNRLRAFVSGKLSGAGVLQSS